MRPIDYFVKLEESIGEFVNKSKEDSDILSKLIAIKKIGDFSSAIVTKNYHSELIWAIEKLKTGHNYFLNDAVSRAEELVVLNDPYLALLSETYQRIPRFGQIMNEVLEEMVSEDKDNGIVFQITKALLEEMSFSKSLITGYGYCISQMSSYEPIISIIKENSRDSFLLNEEKIVISNNPN